MDTAIFSAIALLLAMYAAFRATGGLRRIQKYERCMDDFIQNAEIIVRDKEDVPAAVLGLLAFMRRKAVDPWAALAFVHHLLSKERHKLESAELPEDFVKFLERRPDLAVALARASAAAFLAMAYRGYIVGGFIRRFVLFDARTHGDRTRDLATHYREVEEGPLVQAA